MPTAEPVEVPKVLPNPDGYTLPVEMADTLSVVSEPNSSDLYQSLDDNEEGTDEDLSAEQRIRESFRAMGEQGVDETVVAAANRPQSMGDAPKQVSISQISLHNGSHFSDNTSALQNVTETSNKSENIVETMLLQHNKEKSLTENNWDKLAIDDDIHTSVNGFIKVFFDNYLDEAGKDEKIQTLKALHEKKLRVEMSKWLCAKLQIERGGWTLKIKSAFKEVEEKRKAALRADALAQECCEQLYLLLECFNIQGNEVASGPAHTTREAIQRALDILVNICNALMEDRYQTMQLLQLEDGVEGLLADNLQHHLQVLRGQHQQSVDDLAQLVHYSEQENRKLVTDAIRMKAIIEQRQDDVQWLRKQMVDINDLITTRQVKMSDKSTSTDSDTDEAKTSGVLPPGHPVASSIGKGQAVDPQLKHRAYSTPAIHITQEKLHALKTRAKKLEDSLCDALTNMDIQRKSPGGSQPDRQITPPLFEVVTKNKNETRSRTKANRKTKKTVLDVKSIPPNVPVIQKTIHPHVSVLKPPVPKLMLKHKSNPITLEPRTMSDRVVSREVVDNLKQIELRRTAELSATLAQLKGFRPLAGKVSKCLRCQKLFRSIDNHKLACLHHPQQKKAVEDYSDGGQLLNVLFVWQCCRQPLEADGCTAGQHV